MRAFRERAALHFDLSAHDLGAVSDHHTHVRYLLIPSEVDHATLLNPASLDAQQSKAFQSKLTDEMEPGLAAGQSSDQKAAVSAESRSAGMVQKKQPRRGWGNAHTQLRQFGGRRIAGSLDDRAAADAPAAQKFELDATDVFLRHSNCDRLAVNSAVVLELGGDFVSPRH